MRGLRDLKNRYTYQRRKPFFVQTKILSSPSVRSCKKVKRHGGEQPAACAQDEATGHTGPPGLVETEAGAARKAERSSPRRQEERTTVSQRFD